jgi:acetyltransferase-like isoleucine patch superfamily enzyme
MNLYKLLLWVYGKAAFSTARLKGLLYACVMEEAGREFYVLGGASIYAPRGVRVGEGVTIGKYTDLDGQGGLSIGDDTCIGPYSRITTSNHRFDMTDRPIRFQGFVGAPVKIGNNVWIGAHVVVLPGVSLGDGCIIGAGSIVTHDVPAGVVAVGNPARGIKVRGPDAYVRPPARLSLPSRIKRFIRTRRNG